MNSEIQEFDDAFDKDRISRIAWDVFGYSCPGEQLKMQIAMTLALEKATKLNASCQKLLESFKIHPEIQMPEEEFKKGLQK